MWLQVVAAAAVVALGYVIINLNEAPPKILGVYAQKGTFHWFKEVIFRAIIALRERQNGVTSATGDSTAERPSFTQMESPQKLSDHPKAVDAVYFNGGNTEGIYVVAALARRPRSVFNSIFYVKHPSVGLLKLPRMPDTLLFGAEDRWEAEGLKLECLIPMRTWRLQYDGPMRRHNEDDPEDSSSGAVVEVKFDLEWTANYDHFDFDCDLNNRALARSMAKEAWSRQYFNDLKKAHQTHYEQMGTMRGSLVLGGDKHHIELPSMRDHSYGYKREWRLLHRYALHMLHLEDGTQFNVGIVSQPVSCSNLEVGYMYQPGSRGFTSVSKINFDLWNFGEGGNPPDDYAFSFVEGGRTHILEVKGVQSPVFFVGWEWEARIVEKFVKVKLDGRPGVGVVEFQYNAGPGDHRPPKLALSDPEWTKQLIKG